MGAQYDKSIAAKFHYGNALHDLEHLLPAEDEQAFVPFGQSHLSTQNRSLEVKMETLSSQLDEVLNLQSKLAFALRDLKRSLG